VLLWACSRGAQLLKWPRELMEQWGAWFLFALFAGEPPLAPGRVPRVSALCKGLGQCMWNLGGRHQLANLLMCAFCGCGF
jgi:lauroyl/myristoyl acyltransferase